MNRTLASYELTYLPQGIDPPPLCLRLALDGDVVKKVSIEPTNHEQEVETCLEQRNVREIRSVLKQMSPTNAFSRELAFTQGIERLWNLDVSEEVRLLRVLLLESERVIEHLKTLSQIALDVQLIPVVHAIRRLLKTFDRLVMSVGASHGSNDGEAVSYLCGFLVPGGFDPLLLRNRPIEKFGLWMRFFEQFVPPLVRLIETLLVRNPLFQDRALDLCRISEKEAITFGLSGVQARASGVAFDRRLFKESDHAVLGLSPLLLPSSSKATGDVFARTCIRIDEIRQSLDLMSQGKKRLQSMELLGEKEEFATPDSVLDGLLRSFKSPLDASITANYPVKNVASFVESPSGEFGFFMVSHGETTLYRCQMISPTQKVIQALESLLIGTHVTNLSLILHSLAIVP